MADKSQAEAIAAAQLLAMFGETIESTEEIVKENKSKDKTEEKKDTP